MHMQTTSKISKLLIQLYILTLKMRIETFVPTAFTSFYHFEHLYSPCSELTVISGDDGGLSELVYKVVDR